ADGPDRRLVAHAESEAVAEIADWERPARERDLTGVGEDEAGQALVDRMAELERALDERAPADGLVVEERPDPPAAIAAYPADPARVEPLEERDLPAVGRIGGAQAGARREEDRGGQRLVVAALADDPQELDVAAERSADRLDGAAQDAAAARIEEIVRRVPLDARAESREDRRLRRDAG